MSPSPSWGADVGVADGAAHAGVIIGSGKIYTGQSWMDALKNDVTDEGDKDGLGGLTAEDLDLVKGRSRLSAFLLPLL